MGSAPWQLTQVGHCSAPVFESKLWPFVAQTSLASTCSGHLCTSGIGLHPACATQPSGRLSLGSHYWLGRELCLQSQRGTSPRFPKAYGRFSGLGNPNLTEIQINLTSPATTNLKRYSTRPGLHPLPSHYDHNCAINLTLALAILLSGRESLVPCSSSNQTAVLVACHGEGGGGVCGHLPHLFQE